MLSRRSPRRSPAFPALLLSLLCAGQLHAQAPPAPDRLVLKTGEQQVGRVLGVKDGQVLFQVNAGAISFPLERVARVEAPAPADFQAGMQAYEAGDLDRALAALRPVADGFRGLPTDWARQALATTGDIYVVKKDLARAEAAFNDLRKFYGTAAGGGGSLRASVGQARLMLAKNNAAGARQLLEGLATTALKDPVRVSRADGAALGQAFHLLGGLREAAGDLPGALECYLRTVALFAQDRATVAAAQRSADALRAAHPDLTAP